MRITPKAKQETRARILSAGSRLFGELGFGATSTRDLAGEAGIAAGTLFNYFPTKEALAMTLVVEALERGHETFEARRQGADSLNEELFSYVATGLRELEPYRAFLPEVFETALSPFRPSDASRLGGQVRHGHLEVVKGILGKRGSGGPQAFASLQLYWTLYVGVLAFWTRDESAHQEDTWAVLDQSLGLFVGSITSEDGTDHGS